MTGKTFLTAVVAVCLLYVSASADIPKTINFQGRLTNTAGVPLNGSFNIAIRIYAGSRLLFTEHHVGTAVTDGVFNVLIGSRTVGGVPSAVFETADTTVGVSVGKDAEMTPRLPLASVPYAYVAEAAQALVVPASITAAESGPLLTLNNTGSGDALRGVSTGGKGVYGISVNDYGVYASSTSGPGAIYGQANGAGARGVRGTATSASGSTVGVMGEAMGSASGVGVVANGGMYGLQAYGQAGHGVYGTTPATTGPTFGGYFVGNSHWGGGVRGVSSEGVGVWGEHTHASLTNPAVYGKNTGSGDGVYGTAAAAYSAGVRGVHNGSGAGGLFSSSSGPAVVAEGTVEADKISYRSPRTHYLSLPGEAFQPGSDVPYYNSYGTGGAYIVSGSGALVAPVYLPEGATITELKAWFADASAADMSVKLHRFVLGGGSYAPMAEVSSSGSGGSMNASTTEIAYPVVSNATRAYLIYAYSTDWSSGLKLKNVQITYTVSEAE